MVRRALILLFTLVTFIFSHEIEITYAKIIDSEPIVHYLKMIEADVKLQVMDKITLVAGDLGITNTDLNEYGTIIKEISMPTIKNKLDLMPIKKITISLFTTPESYGQALLEAGVASSEVASIVKGSGGCALNSSIWIPLYNLEGMGEFTNAITHELTHVILNQAGIASQLPLWLNEGTAWITGLAAYEMADAFQAKVQMLVLRENVENLVDKGELQPLQYSLIIMRRISNHKEGR